MRRWLLRRKLRKWKRLLALRIIDLRAQQENPIGGEWVDTKEGRRLYTEKLENKITEAKHRIQICRGHLGLGPIKIVMDLPGAKVVE